MPDRFADSGEFQNHLEDLWGLRAAYSRMAKARFDLEVAKEKELEDCEKQIKKSLETAVEIADGLRELVEDAKSNVAPPPPEEETGFLGRWFGGKKETTPESFESDWVNAFGRLWGMARNRLEMIGVEYVELVGKDLRKEEIHGHPAVKIVSVKNKPDGDALIVQREFRGAWVRLRGETLVIVQRGEVFV